MEMSLKYMIMLLVVFGAGFAAGAYYEKPEANVTGNIIVEPETEQGLPSDFKANLNKYVQVPEDAMIARIDNITLVKKTQPQIYANARNGDYIIAFSDNVIVYDYNNNKVIDIFKVK